MPWSGKQKQVAQAVAHGWKPTGTAKGFTQTFAKQVISESKPKKKAKAGSIGDMLRK